MEVGNLRERIVTALLVLAYGKKRVSFPATTSPESDVFLDGKPISIKTKTGQSLSGVKLMWATDWDTSDQFCSQYCPTVGIIYVNIRWNDTGCFSFIPLEVQQDVFLDLKNGYIKEPSKGTNSRGAELSAEALRNLLKDKRTLQIPIFWNNEDPNTNEYKVYEKWIDKWKEF